MRLVKNADKSVKEKIARRLAVNVSSSDRKSAKVNTVPSAFSRALNAWAQVILPMIAIPLAIADWRLRTGSLSNAANSRPAGNITPCVH
jgi:hypothetical protein